MPEHDHRRRPHLLAIVAGFAFAVHVVGFRVINPFDTTWLSGEAAHSYLGRAFFRHESAVPLGIVGKRTLTGFNFGFSEGTSDGIGLGFGLGCRLSIGRNGRP